MAIGSKGMERVLSQRTVKFCSGRPTHQTPRIIAMLSESAAVSASGRAEVGLFSVRVRSSVGRSEERAGGTDSNEMFRNEAIDHVVDTLAP